MKYLITGSAGFIGFHLCQLLLKDKNNKIIGVDNHNSYYDPRLKESRLLLLKKNSNYIHCRVDIADTKSIAKIFKNFKPKFVINLAAQAGVRYSIKNPYVYIKSNINGFINILEESRKNKIRHLVYASTSSVYGANTKLPFAEEHSTNHQLSIYAVTKKSNELMAHAYSYLYNIPTTGLRFFTVYGPWGRPDMALFKFIKAIIKKKKINVFNYGNHSRDFTYVDDIVKTISKIIKKPAKKNQNWISTNPDPSSSFVPWRIYNIGNSKPVKLLKYISAIEKILNIKAKIKFLPLQLGDVKDTFASTTKLFNQFNYKPKTKIIDGIKKFIDWYKNYYNV